jgi:transketolase
MSFNAQLPSISPAKAAPDVAALRLAARRVRATCIQMAHDAKHGHLKSALSCIDILVALYGGFLSVTPDHPRDPGRDRLLFSKGHAVTALYAVQALYGYIPPAELDDYCRTGHRLPDHPCRHALPLLEMSSGSLGYGLGIGTGMMHAMMLDGKPGRVVAVLSDGECNEGSVWEAAMFAAAHSQNRLLAIIDYNGLQAVGRSAELMAPTEIAEKFQGFGWEARTIDGNDLEHVTATLADVPFSSDRPSALIARTRSGAGVSFMENDLAWHYRAPSAEDLANALAELGVAPLHRERRP